MANVVGAGRFCWFNLAAADPEAAKKFYTRIFGWRTSEQNGVTMWESPAGPVGSVGRHPAAGATGEWLPYIAVADIEASVARAQALGGSVTLAPTATGMGGSFAHLEDPQGAAFGLYSPADVAWAPPAIGQFSWVELLTTDVAAALAFYFELAGWQEISSLDMDKLGKYHIFGSGSDSYGGIFNPGASPMGPQWFSYVRVADVAALTAAARALGATVVNGPMQVPGGDWIVQLADPQGALIAAHQKQSQAATMPKARAAAAKKRAPARRKSPAKKKVPASKRVVAKPRVPTRRKPVAKARSKVVARSKVATKKKAAPARRGARKPARRKK